MTSLRPFALFFIAACAGPSWSAGPNIYKCGSTYSQTPCDGAQAMQVDDARSKEQKLQSETATKRQGKTANAMEQARLKEEAQANARGQPKKTTTKPVIKTQAKAPADSGSMSTATDNKRKKKESEFFTAKEAAPAKK